MRSLKITALLIALTLTCNLFLFGQEKDDDRVVGLALSGGGAKGLAYIGMLEVIDSIGLPIDYIAGTSIGSIIGGMTALGYSPSYLQNLAGSMNWGYLLGNKVEREYLSESEKILRTCYQITFSVAKDFKIQLPSGVLNGQHIDDLFTRLYSPYYKITDFSQLPVPFLCIAIDLSTGKPVEFTEGYLPDAIRASMNVPLAMKPKQIGDKMYIDGGIVNNFPVQNLKERGVKYVVGLDVQHDLQVPDSIQTVFEVARQFMDVGRKSVNETGRALTDIYIQPDIRGMNMGSFAQNKSIIERGKEAVLKHVDDLSAMADSLKSLGHKPYKFLNTVPLDSVYVEKIEVEGLSKNDFNNVRHKITFNVPGYVQLDEIERSLNYLRGTFYFETVTYQLAPGENDAIVIFRFEKMPPNTVSAGMNFFRYKYATLMLNATFRHFGKLNSAFSIDLGISTFPYMYAEYVVVRKNFFDFGVAADVYSLPLLKYSSENNIPPSSKLIMLNTVTGVFAKANLSPYTSLSLSADFETFSRVSSISSVTAQSLGNLCLSSQLTLDVDKIDNMAFPKKGYRVYSRTKGIFYDFSANNSKPFMTTCFNATFATTTEMKRTNLSFITEANLGLTLFGGDFLPYMFYLGGIERHRFMNLIPFGGMGMMREKTNNLLSVRENVQFEFVKNHYTILAAEAATWHDDLTEEILSFDNTCFSLGLTYGWNTPVMIPLKLSAFKAIGRKGFEFYLSIGLSF